MSSDFFHRVWGNVNLFGLLIPLALVLSILDRYLNLFKPFHLPVQQIYLLITLLKGGQAKPGF